MLILPAVLSFPLGKLVLEELVGLRAAQSKWGDREGVLPL